MKAHTLIGLAAVTALGSAATADFTYSFDVDASAFQFELQNEGPLEGFLESVGGNFFMVEGAGNTWADDLTVLIADESLTNIYVQIGGYSDIGAEYRYLWPQGASGLPFTQGGGYIEGINLDVTGYYVYIGNGYMGGGPAFWTGEIDLRGSVVPAPGALAVLGFAGLAGRRRRA